MLEAWVRAPFPLPMTWQVREKSLTVSPCSTKGKLVWDGKVSEIDESGNDYVDQFIHGRAEGPIELDVRAADGSAIGRDLQSGGACLAPRVDLWTSTRIRSKISHICLSPQ